MGSSESSKRGLLHPNELPQAAKVAAPSADIVVPDEAVESTEFSSRIVSVGTTWPGYDNLKYLIIFGDSFSDVGYQAGRAAHPTPAQPLGVPFPGDTYAEPGEPNWVGHLVVAHCRRAEKPAAAASELEIHPNIVVGPFTTESNLQSRLLVYDYAVGGAQMPSVEHQFDDCFMHPGETGTRPQWAPWGTNDTLFVTWVGINDCSGSPSHSEKLARYFTMQSRLYAIGARNFCFIDVPPVHRFPGIPDRAKRSVVDWNMNLYQGTQKFADEHPEATVMLYSSWETFNSVLDNPLEYGFTEVDVTKGGNSIWVDKLHPTSRMHQIFARDIERLLLSCSSGH